MPAITQNTTLLAPARVNLDRLVRYYANREAGEYTPEDVRVILGHYVTLGESIGLDPLVSVAQLSLESGHLGSWWSQRPRRNPAGIGVTGATLPDGTPAGVSFPSWIHATRAHVGRLLAYALPYDTGTPEQRRLKAEALAWRPLAPALQGRAPTLKGLERAWAADRVYAAKLAKIANNILKV